MSLEVFMMGRVVEYIRIYYGRELKLLGGMYSEKR
jgi:hypothetical protein